MMKKLVALFLVCILCVFYATGYAEKDPLEYLHEGLSTYAFKKEIDARILGLQDRFEKEGKLTELEGTLLLRYLRASCYLVDIGMIECDRAFGKDTVNDNTAFLIQATDVSIEVLDEIERWFADGEISFDEMITLVMPIAVAGISAE